MTVQYETVPGQPMTAEQIDEVKKAALSEVVCDEDCPELSESMMKSLKAAVRNRNRQNQLRKA